MKWPVEATERASSEYVNSSLRIHGVAIERASSTRTSTARAMSAPRATGAAARAVVRSASRARADGRAAASVAKPDLGERFAHRSRLRSARLDADLGRRLRDLTHDLVLEQ